MNLQPITEMPKKSDSDRVKELEDWFRLLQEKIGTCVTESDICTNLEFVLYEVFKNER